MCFRRFTSLLLSISLFTLITGCAWFRGESAKSGTSTEDGSLTLSNIETGDEGLPPDLSSQGELSGRPMSDWKPIENKKVTVYFAYDQSTIGTSQVAHLDAVANYMKSHPEIGLIIQGHCDERGSHEYNIGLGERRALAIRNFLVNLGVPDNRMQTISYGSEKPADLGHDEKAYSKNRRADIIPAQI